MSELRELRLEAARVARQRGHMLRVWDRLSATKAGTTCAKCGAWVRVDTNPAPNGIDIAGEAVAVDCEGSDE